VTEHREKEFEELANNIRHWEQMRWVSMTVFMAIMAVSLGAYLEKKDKIDVFSAYCIRTVCVMIVLIFWVQDERIVKYWSAFRDRARQVEKKLDICVFSASPARGLISAGTAVRILYTIFLLFWIAQLFV
jgi:hypothetical protein